MSWKWGGGKSLTFYQDEESPKDWYMEIGKVGELKLRVHDNKGPSTNSSSIGKEIKESTGNSVAKSLRVLIGNPITKEDITIRPLLIKNNSVR